MIDRNLPLTTQDGDALELTAEALKLMRPMREVDPGLVERFIAERKRMKRERQLDWLIPRLVGYPFLLAFACALPFIVVACRLMGRGR